MRNAPYSTERERTGAGAAVGRGRRGLSPRDRRRQLEWAAGQMVVWLCRLETLKLRLYTDLTEPETWVISYFWRMRRGCLEESLEERNHERDGAFTAEDDGGFAKRAAFDL